VHFVGLFLSSLLKMHGPKNKISELLFSILLTDVINAFVLFILTLYIRVWGYFKFVVCLWIISTLTCNS